MRLREFVNELQANVHRMVRDNSLKAGQTPMEREQYVRMVGHNNGLMEAVAVAQGMLAQASEDEHAHVAPDAPRRLVMKGD